MPTQSPSPNASPATQGQTEIWFKPPYRRGFSWLRRCTGDATVEIAALRQRALAAGDQTQFKLVTL